MTNNETILKYVSDMAASEHQLAHAIKTQVTDDDLKEFPEVTTLLTKIRTTAEQHLSGLENLAKSLDGEARSSLKEAVTAVTGSAVGVISHLREHNVSKMLRDDYIILSMNSVGYSMLHTTGLALMSNSTASLAISYLQDTAALIMELSQESIPVVVGELEETNGVTTDVTSLAQTNVRNAWTHNPES